MGSSLTKKNRIRLGARPRLKPATCKILSCSIYCQLVVLPLITLTITELETLHIFHTPYSNRISWNCPKSKLKAMPCNTVWFMTWSHSQVTHVEKTGQVLFHVIHTGAADSQTIIIIIDNFCIALFTAHTSQCGLQNGWWFHIALWFINDMILIYLADLKLRNHKWLLVNDHLHGLLTKWLVPWALMLVGEHTNHYINNQ